KTSANAVLRGEGPAIREYMFKQGGHDNPNTPVPHMEEPGEEASEDHQKLWTKRTALRALIRSGILPGKIEEGPGR
ncbi:MAG: hypothetical protein EBV03_14125, partial [Proteobacteria bacterium]|nr:hypothetical protein [Pseudomonadota bacterium]